MAAQFSQICKFHGVALQSNCVFSRGKSCNRFVPTVRSIVSFPRPKLRHPVLLPQPVSVIPAVLEALAHRTEILKINCKILSWCRLVMIGDDMSRRRRRHTTDVENMTRTNDDSTCSPSPSNLIVPAAVPAVVKPLRVIQAGLGLSETVAYGVRKSREQLASRNGHMAERPTSWTVPGQKLTEHPARSLHGAQLPNSLRAPLADAHVEEDYASLDYASSTHSLRNSASCCRCDEQENMLGMHRRTQRCSSCLVISRKSARLALEEMQVQTPTSMSKTSLLLECIIENLSSVIAEFQQGVCALNFKDGDLAARNGHMHIARHVADTFTEQAVVHAAAEGHFEMVMFLHENRKEGTTMEAMDLAATFGHLDVVWWLHTNRTEGCTTRAMDGAARNAHIHVRIPHHDCRV